MLRPMETFLKGKNTNNNQSVPIVCPTGDRAAIAADSRPYQGGWGEHYLNIKVRTYKSIPFFFLFIFL